MAQVTLRINGYAYVLGCADGEEDHLLALALDLDHRIDEIKVATGPSGEARLLLMAALMISDELHDLRQQQDVPPRTEATRTVSTPEPKIGRRLKGIARRAEAIADSAEALTSAPDGSDAIGPDEAEDRKSSGKRPGEGTEKIEQISEATSHARTAPASVNGPENGTPGSTSQWTGHKMDDKAGSGASHGAGDTGGETEPASAAPVASTPRQP